MADKIKFDIRTSKHDNSTIFSVCENGIALQDYPTAAQAERYLKRLKGS